MKKFTLLFIAGLAMVAISAFTVLDANGSKTFSTGSPYDKGNTCSNQAGCHSGGTSTPSVTITPTPAFGAGNTYMAGTTYTISVKCSGSYSNYGFGLEILNSNTTTAADAGTFGTVVTNNCKKWTTAGKPTNITQTAMTPANSATFSFRWAAPASGIAYLYCAVNGVNADNLSTGDIAKTYSLAIAQSTASVPAIEQNLFNLTVNPNPASDYATINYTLKETTDIKIELYDISGKKAGILLAENQSSGEHQQTINFSAMNLNPGTYLIAMKAGDKISNKRLVIK